MEGVLAGGFCFPSSQGLRRILDQKCGEKGASDLEESRTGSGERRSVSPVGCFQGLAGWKWVLL